MTARAGLEAIAVLGALAAACRAPSPASSSDSAPRSDTLALAIYQRDAGHSFAVVDDRRWIAVTAGAVSLEHIDPRADLASLHSEPLAGTLALTACTRDPMPAPATGFADVLHCATSSAPGRYFARVLYVVPGFGYRASHVVATTGPAQATISSRYAFDTPAWHRRAQVTLFTGVPGGDQPVHQLARGDVLLDGAIAVLASPARSLPAHLRWVYAGPAPEPNDDTELMLRRRGHDTRPTVRVWLELADAAGLVTGAIHAHVTSPAAPQADFDIGAYAPRRGDPVRDPVLRLPLWTDDALAGRAELHTESADAPDDIIDRYDIAVSNTSDTPREVWIEQPLRPLPHRPVHLFGPGKPQLDGDTLRVPLAIAPGKLEHARFEIAYQQR